MALIDKRPDIPRSEKFSASIHCPNCHQIGAAFWEEGRSRDGAKRGQSRLLDVSSGFYVADAQAEAGGYNIVCDHCDTVLSD